MLEFTPLTEEDLAFLVEVRNECRDCLHDNRVFTLDESVIWFRRKRPDYYVIRINGGRIGYFRTSDYNPNDASIYVGADLHSAYRGRGFAKRAYDAFLPRLKAQYQLRICKLEVLSHNTVAQRLYQKLGFKEIDRKPGYALREGRLVDSIVMVKEMFGIH